MALTDAQSRFLAEHCYGYGRWDAPYWFIGPEQGQPKSEKDDLTPRFHAFIALQDEGLCDCREFHEQLPGTNRWHSDNPRLQSTWRRLMLTIIASKPDCDTATPVSKDLLRNYQANLLGSQRGETCIIDLSGLAANNLKILRERDEFRGQRIRFIHEKIELHKPRYVVIYGVSQWRHWETFWKTTPEVKQSVDSLMLGPTTIALMAQPTAHKQTDRKWIELGEKLRAA